MPEEEEEEEEEIRTIWCNTKNLCHIFLLISAINSDYFPEHL
jgi:hypothetical protein